MKTTSSSLPSPELVAGADATLTVNETDGMTTTPMAPGTVRVLLAVDVPQAALPSIEADWALVAQTQNAAPEYVPTVVAAALRRLQEQAVQVGGVAVALPSDARRLLPGGRAR